MLAAGGGLAGIVLAAAGTRALTWLNPANLPRLDAVRIDGDVLLFAVCASTLTARVLRPGPGLARRGPRSEPHAARPPARASVDQVRLRSALMIGEMALALVLLIGAGLMIRSFAALQQVRPGFDPAGVLTFRLAMPLREVSPAGGSRRVPPPDGGAAARAAGRHGGRVHVAAAADRQRVAVAVRVQRRDRAQLGERDVATAAACPRRISARWGPACWPDGSSTTTICPGRAAIIIDETLAARAWPGESAIGKRLQVQPNGSDNPFAEVIGVVEHIRAHDLSRPVRPQIYTPVSGSVRRLGRRPGSVDPGSLAPQVRKVMERLDPDLPHDRVRPMSASWPTASGSRG